MVELAYEGLAGSAWSQSEGVLAEGKTERCDGDWRREAWKGRMESSSGEKRRRCCFAKWSPGLALPLRMAAAAGTRALIIWLYQWGTLRSCHTPAIQRGRRSGVDVQKVKFTRNTVSAPLVAKSAAEVGGETGTAGRMTESLSHIL